MTHRSSRMKSEACYAIILNYAAAATTLVRLSFTMEIHNDPMNTARATQQFLKGKKWDILQWPSQSDLNTTEHAFL